MANTFTRKISRNIGATLTSVGGYTVGGGVQTTVIGLSIANTSSSPITVNGRSKPMMCSRVADATRVWVIGLCLRWQ